MMKHTNGTFVLNFPITIKIEPLKPKIKHFSSMYPDLHNYAGVSYLTGVSEYGFKTRNTLGMQQKMVASLIVTEKSKDKIDTETISGRRYKREIFIISH